MSERCEVLVVGGGPTGSLAALALAAIGREVLLLEAHGARPSGFDERALALTRGSVALLEALGVWARLSVPPTPIRRVRLSVAGAPGGLSFEAADLGAEALGAVVGAAELGAALAAALAASRVRVLAPARLVALRPGEDTIEATVALTEGERRLAARLLVGADGAGSAARELAGIGLAERGPERVLLVAGGHAERAHEGTAFLRPAPAGQVALLPRAGRAVTAVLSPGEGSPPALTAQAFAEAVQGRFGYRLGRLRFDRPPIAHRLRSQRAAALTAPRLVLLGQAALSVHPVAAQGLNLALRDLAHLAERLAEGGDPGEPSRLAAYAGARAPEHRAVLGLTEGLLGLFSPASAGVAPLRQLALMATGRIAPLRRRLLAWLSGGRPPLPALLRGRLP
ncbi:MAG: FAD-dependent monooxygenase [Xanthomonadales bacterium]|nr:FAD-dependent monooxygenase [Xanthomonadales bacterium]